jgi:hypothetical protein
MSVQEQFDSLSREWADHCKRVRYSSNLSKYLDHAAYRQLVQLGLPIIPNIIAAYQSDELPWGFVLQAITGLRMIADPNAFNPAEMRQRWLQWWQQRQESQSATTPPIDGSPGTVETPVRS